MKQGFAVFVLALFLAPALWAEEARSRPEVDLPLFYAARDSAPMRYFEAVRKGADVKKTPDGRSFYLVWKPEGVQNPPVVVTLHGSRTWAFNEFVFWHEHAARQGVAVLALQWWLGGGDNPADYYAPQELEPLISAILKDEGFEPGRVMLHGFRRGADVIDTLSGLDQAREKWFNLTAANADPLRTIELFLMRLKKE